MYNYYTRHLMRWILINWIICLQRFNPGLIYLSLSDKPGVLSDEGNLLATTLKTLTGLRKL